MDKGAKYLTYIREKTLSVSLYSGAAPALCLGKFARSKRRPRSGSRMLRDRTRKRRRSEERCGKENSPREFTFLSPSRHPLPLPLSLFAKSSESADIFQRRARGAPPLPKSSYSFFGIYNIVVSFEKSPRKISRATFAK